MDIINNFDFNSYSKLFIASVAIGASYYPLKSVLNRYSNFEKLKDDKNYKYDIEVDGGINFSNSKDVINAGANILVSGTTIFKENNGNIKKNIETLKEV